MPLTTRLTTHLQASLTAGLDLSTPVDALNRLVRLDLATGTGSGQADLMWHDARTLAASANEDLDVAGVLTSGLGATVTMARIKLLWIAAAAANTNTVVVTRPASNGVPIFSAASDAMALRPGGQLLITAPDATGIAVTAGTGDLINVGNGSSGTSVTYSVVIIGASA